MPLPELEHLLISRPADGVLQITLNRPDKLNALTFDMFDELTAVCRALEGAQDVRVGEHPQQRLSGRPARGDDFSDALAWDTEKVQVALGQDLLVHRRQLFQARHAGHAAKQLAVKWRVCLHMVKSFRPVFFKRGHHQLQAEFK